VIEIQEIGQTAQKALNQQIFHIFSLRYLSNTNFNGILTQFSCIKTNKPTPQELKYNKMESAPTSFLASQVAILTDIPGNLSVTDYQNISLTSSTFGVQLPARRPRLVTPFRETESHNQTTPTPNSYMKEHFPQIRDSIATGQRNRIRTVTDDDSSHLNHVSVKSENEDVCMSVGVGVGCFSANEQMSLPLPPPPSKRRSRTPSPRQMIPLQNTYGV